MRRRIAATVDIALILAYYLRLLAYEIALTLAGVYGHFLGRWRPRTPAVEIARQVMFDLDGPDPEEPEGGD